MTTRRKKLSPEVIERRSAGQSEAHAIRRYLNALADEPQRVRGRSMERQLADIDAQLADTDIDLLDRVNLIARRAKLRGVDMEAEEFADIEGQFVKVVAGYSERKRIPYAAWREVGVPAKPLRAAGLRP